MGVLRTLSLLIFITLSTNTYCNTTLNGASVYQDLGREVFVGSLYLEHPDNKSHNILESDQELKIKVVMLDFVSKRRWINIWMQSIAINNPGDRFENQADTLVEIFEKIQGSLQKNDVFEVTYKPDVGTMVSLDSIPIVQKPGRDLVVLFLRAWIGPVPPSTQFKEMILGKENYQAVVSKQPTNKPGAARVQVIKQWLVKENNIIATEIGTEQEISTDTLHQETIDPEPGETQQDNKTPPTEEVFGSNSVAVPESTVLESTLPVNTLPESTQSETTLNKKTFAEGFEEEIPEPDDSKLSVALVLAQREYTTQVVRKIYEGIVYPRKAISRNIQGSVKLFVSIARSGEVNSFKIEESSGSPILDEAALDAVKKVGTFDTIPDSITETPQELSIPISFRLN